MNKNLDPEPWHDDRPGVSLTRGTLPWGHAHFDPRPEYSQESSDYQEQFAKEERRELFYSAGQTRFTNSEDIETFVSGATWAYEFFKGRMEW